MKGTTRELCVQGLLIALVAVCTMSFRIPVAATQGYIHLGDSMILLIGVFFGARYGAVAGGVGSALADILSGYSHWAPFTLIIKSVMGWLIGKLAAGHRKEKFFTGRNVLASVVGVMWMVFGYFVGGGILKSSFAVAATSIPGNLIQGAAGAVIFFVVGAAFHKAGIERIVSKER